MSEQRDCFAKLIAERLTSQQKELATAWRNAKPVRHLVLDDLLPAAVATRISRAFPAPSGLQQKNSLRERKKVGVKVEQYDPVIGDALYAFQQPEVVAAVGRITAIPELIADPSLYAGGVSVMARDDFLNPHVDNSHDGDQNLYRVVNLLYYTSPGWQEDCGGHLELWDQGVRNPVRLSCRFNRLAIMETNLNSWHSVCRVTADRPRQCVSNYYFSAAPPDGVPYRHVTTFTGRPEEPLKRLVLGVMDGVVLNAIGRLFPSVLKRNRLRRVAHK